MTDYIKRDAAIRILEMALSVVERYVNETGAVINVTDRRETRHYFEFEGRETDD